MKPEAYPDAILDPQTGENVDLQMKFPGLQTAIELRKVQNHVSMIALVTHMIH